MIDREIGAVVIAGERVFPIGLSNGPPLGKKAPSGQEGLAEVAGAGANFVRTGIAEWNLEQIRGQVAAEEARLDAAAAHGLYCWLWLGDVANLPRTARGAPPSANERLLTTIADTFVGHPALGAYKGIDEPRNPSRGKNWIRPAGLVRAYKELKRIDARHPLVIIQAPRSPISELVPYRPAFDITGVDVYPVSYPPGVHSDSRNRDISVVGDMTAKMITAGGGKPVWTTLQIAWSGTIPTSDKPARVPRFPSLKEERFMAYQAIVSGARGLFFFGGHLTQVASPDDARRGWNWTFWRETLRPLVTELASKELRPALLAPDAKPGVKAKAADVRVVTRRASGSVYVIAVRRGGTTTRVQFSGLPRKHDGTPLSRGEVLFEYVQQPLPPPVRPNHQVPRPIEVLDGSFGDWFGPHDVHVYRFRLT